MLAALSAERAALHTIAARKARIAMENCVHRVDAVVVYERRRARQHFAKHYAKREHVAATIDTLAQQLFGRHVIHGAQQCA